MGQRHYSDAWHAKAPRAGMDALNRAAHPLDAALSLLLLGPFGSAAPLLIAASFLAGFAVGKFAVWPLIGWLL